MVLIGVLVIWILYKAFFKSCKPTEAAVAAAVAKEKFSGGKSGYGNLGFGMGGSRLVKSSGSGLVVPNSRMTSRNVPEGGYIGGK